MVHCACYVRAHILIILNGVLLQILYYTTDGSNDQNLEKINPVSVRLFDIEQHKFVANP